MEASRHEPHSHEGACPVCGGSDLDVMYEAAGVPALANNLWPDREGAVDCTRGDIVLSLCRTCGFIFNAAFDPTLLAYTEQYENVLHHSPRFQEYARSLAEMLIERYDLHGKDVVEIGCGRGDFLRMLCRMGDNRGTGFDPGCGGEPEAGSGAPRVRFIKDRFGERHGPIAADFVYSRQVLEHVPDPRGFLSIVRAALGERSGAGVFFEVPNALYTIRNRFIWDVIYEHCSYFTAAAIEYLFSVSGFVVRAVSAEFGGQYLAVHASPDGAAGEGSRQRAADVERLVSEAASFRDDCRRLIDSWRERIDLLRRGGGRVVVWGGGSKGITFSNLLGLGEVVPYVVDVNPRKEGMFVAGTGQRIVAPPFLSGYRPDAVIVVNPIYLEEIEETAGKLGINPQFVVL